MRQRGARPHRMMSIMATGRGAGQGWAGAFDAGRSALVDLAEPADDDRPLSVRIAEVLTAAIEARTPGFGQGTRLPPAASIAHRFATSVDTGRSAVRVLGEAGGGAG